MLVATALLGAAPAFAQTDPCESCREAPPAPPAPIQPLPPVADPMEPRLDGVLIETQPMPPSISRPALPRPNILFRYELGGVYTHALERDLGGARLDFEVGYDGPHATVGGRAGIEAGGTQSGLPYQRLSWGFGIDGKLGPVRLGVEPRIGGLLVGRATTTDPTETMAALTLGAHLECIVALLGAGSPSTRSHGGLDLILRTGYDWIDVTNGRFDASHTVTAKIGIGGRY